MGKVLASEDERKAMEYNEERGWEKPHIIKKRMKQAWRKIRRDIKQRRDDYSMQKKILSDTYKEAFVKSKKEYLRQKARSDAKRNVFGGSSSQANKQNIMKVSNKTSSRKMQAPMLFSSVIMPNIKKKKKQESYLDSGLYGL